VAELTADNAEIRWSVHLANKKAAWFQFQLAQDIPEEASAPPQLLRNATVSDRNSLCLADAFHPGCEMTWPMRQASLYMSAFRIKHADPDWIEPEYGAMFIQDMMGLPNGPLAGQVPGGITRWMAVPWQTDTASCRSGYTPQYDPYLPTFWPARVPNQVLSAENYDIVVDEARPLGERLAAFANRVAWIRPILKPMPDGDDPSYTEQINRFVEDISQMGVVETRSGVAGNPSFPPVMEVEEVPPHTMRAFAASTHGTITRDPTDLANTPKARRFPYGLKQFR
jgi:L-lysine epsilon oxidase C-terminal domain/L-Lysine epsilon oxidase N-terminal